jgi:hypothetical protein
MPWTCELWASCAFVMFCSGAGCAAGGGHAVAVGHGLPGRHALQRRRARRGGAEFVFGPVRLVEVGEIESCQDKYEVSDDSGRAHVPDVLQAGQNHTLTELAGVS